MVRDIDELPGNDMVIRDIVQQILVNFAQCFRY